MQKGIVKTRGRMVNGQLVPGKGLPAATIQIKGMNYIVSHDDGQFSFSASAEYQLQGVKKQGYQMVDQEACRAYKPSNNTLYIVMETPEQQRRDILEAQRKIRNNLEQQLRSRESEIEQMQVAVAMKDSLMDLLYQQQGDNEKLITDMAKRYSELDYDQLDEFYRQVSYAIEQGQLTRADSLLRSRGDLNQQVDNIIKNGQTIQKEKQKIERAEAVQQADVEEAAQRCYKFYETFLAQHKNDSAAHYISLRAQLDSLHFDWQDDAGLFMMAYLGDYAKAEEYFNRVMRIAQDMDDGVNMGVAGAYNNLALLAYTATQDEQKALEYFTKAARLVGQLKGKESAEYATCIANIGMVYNDHGIYSAALRHQLKALSIREKTEEGAFGKSYLTLGVIYSSLYDYPKAIESLRKAQELIEKSEGKQSLNLATCLKEFGNIYQKQSDYPKALECYTQALDMQKEILGEKHPEVSLTSHTIASFYFFRKDYQKALEFFLKDLDISEQQHQYGNANSVNFKTIYYNIATCYSRIGDTEHALEHLYKALHLIEKQKGAESVDLLDICQSIGETYLSTGDSIKAAGYLQRAANIRQRYVGSGMMFGKEQTDNTDNRNNAAKELETHLKLLAVLEQTEAPDPLDVADVCEKIGSDYTTLTVHDKSMDYQMRALNIRKQQLGERSLAVADSYQSLAHTYIGVGELEKALEMAQQALSIRVDSLGTDHPDVGSVYITMGVIYRIQENWEKILECFLKVADIKEKVWGPDFYDNAALYQNIAAAYYYLNEYPLALEYLKRELRIEEMVLGADDEATQNTKANIAETEKEIKLQEALLREEYVIVGTVVDDDCAARQQGMDGSYIILELDTWTVGDEMNYFIILQALQGKPKTLVVLKDDVVSRHHFENFIGISNKRKHVGKEEKQRIVDLYQQWKENNAQ